MGISGKRLLVLEDNFLIADDLAWVLRELGHTVIGPVATARAAADILVNNAIDGAILDVRLQTSDSSQVARELDHRHIPYAVVSGFEHGLIPSGMRGAPFLGKPYSLAELEKMVNETFRV